MANSQNSFFSSFQDSNKILAEIDQLVENDNRLSTDAMLTLLSTTTDSSVRNAVAVALSDWKEEKAIPILLNLLEQESTKHNRGTLIYSLQSYDAESFLPIIAQQVCAGNFEVKENALQIFIDLPDELDQDKLNESLNILKEYPEKDEYVIQATEILEEILSNNKS